MAVLDELHAAGSTLVLITHAADVAAVAQRSIRLLDGLVVRESELAG
jgi:ABC-type lipoprotein export system ATPase subunit